MEAIRDLSVDLNEVQIRHNKISNIVFGDSDQSRTLERIRKAANTNELADASEIIKWCYEELSECAVVRCKTCFTLHETSKPRLASLTPRRAQQILYQSSSGTLAVGGILFKKEQTRALINGKNQLWYRQK